MKTGMNGISGCIFRSNPTPFLNSCIFSGSPLDPSGNKIKELPLLKTELIIRIGFCPPFIAVRGIKIALVNLPPQQDAYLQFEMRKEQTIMLDYPNGYYDSKQR